MPDIRTERCTVWGWAQGFSGWAHCARPRIPNRRDTLLYEDEFELTFQVPEEESAPEPLAAPAAKPAAPVEPVVG